MEAVAKALLTVIQEVFITDLWLSLELMLVRPINNKTFRLDNILERVINTRVHVYVKLSKVSLIFELKITYK
ncbi:unnamed protein product [Rotaria sordida]|uniref:Uncharacterized protein n=1 Tax=Rotaria sordida TaxID=392033 RepID=A0A815IJ89_9BILA|nr:unnamed protein product [Rotaria sordida]CAF4001299.1 unnamed protein product [Rotaria sordida]